MGRCPYLERRSDRVFVWIRNWLSWFMIRSLTGVYGRYVYINMSTVTTVNGGYNPVILALEQGQVIEDRCSL